MNNVSLGHILIRFASRLGTTNALYGFVFQLPVGAFQGGTFNAVTSTDSWFFLLTIHRTIPFSALLDLLGQGCNR